MADKNQLKIAKETDFSDDDPFAELTRIMGFDPRQPAARGEPVASPQPRVTQESATFSDEDFSLDLEQELLGSFDLDDDFADHPVSHVSANDQHARYGQPGAQVGSQIADDHDFSSSFEEALGIPASPQHDQAFGAPSRQAPPPPEDDFDFALSEDDMRDLSQAVASPVAEPFAARQPATQPAPLPRHPLEVQTSQVDPSDDQSVDLGLFEDMDFGFDADHNTASGQNASETAADLEPVISDAVWHDEAPRYEQNDFAAAGFPAEPQIELDEAAFSFSDEAYAAEYDTHSSLPAADETAFEDYSASNVQHSEPELPEPELPESELPEPAAAAKRDPNAFEFSVPAYVPHKLPVSPMDVAAEEYRNRDTAPAQSTYSIEDELNALLGSIRADKKPAAPVEQSVVQPVSAPATAAHDADMHLRPAMAPFAGAAAASVLPSAPVEIGNAQVDTDIDAANVDIGYADQATEEEMDWEFDETFSLDTVADPVADMPQEAYVHEADLPEVSSEPVYRDEPSVFEQAEALADDQIGTIDFGNAFEDFEHQLRHDDTAAGYQPAYEEEIAIESEPVVAAAQSYDDAQPYDDVEAYDSAPAYEQAAPDALHNTHRDPVVRGNPLMEDPLKTIEKMAEQYSSGDSRSEVAREREVQEFDDDFDISDFFEAQPEVETVEIDDRAVSLAQDFEIPELPVEEAVPQASPYDDLDAEFSNLLNGMNSEPEAPKTSAAQTDPLSGQFDVPPYGAAASAQWQQPQAASAKQADNRQVQDEFQLDDALYAGLVQPDDKYAAQDEFGFDGAFDDEQPVQMAPAKSKPFSRYLLVGGLVAGVAILGAIGAFALSFGGGQETPTLVRADDGPVKVRPENPGGATVPNQDNKVYQTVAGSNNTGAPQQEALVSTSEEPIDVSPPAMEDDTSISGKSEDRIEQIVRDTDGQSENELVAVAPRKVRTMVVKPDGTLMEREDEPVAASQADLMSSSTPAAPLDTVAQEPIPGVPAAPAAAPDPAPAQVAAATTAAASANGWAMQIASQPSEAAAQTSYQDLARRYSSVLGGRQFNIVKADVAGKGTFWRVRVLADTRAEAISLCETYKAAGGSCFVSR